MCWYIDGEVLYVLVVYTDLLSCVPLFVILSLMCTFSSLPFLVHMLLYICSCTFALVHILDMLLYICSCTYALVHMLSLVSKVEMHDPKSKERFGLLLSEYLRHCGTGQRRLCEQQQRLWSEDGMFANVCLAVQAVKGKGKAMCKKVREREREIMREGGRERQRERHAIHRQPSPITITHHRGIQCSYKY